MDKVFGRRRRKGQKRQTTQRQPANPPARQGMIRLCFFSRIFSLSLSLSLFFSISIPTFLHVLTGLRGMVLLKKKLVSIYPRTDWWRTWPRLIRPSMLFSLSLFFFFLFFFTSSVEEILDSNLEGILVEIPPDLLWAVF